MFVRYSDRSKRILSFARLKAEQNGAPMLDVHHLIMGLIMEDQGCGVGEESVKISWDESLFEIRLKRCNVHKPFLVSRTAQLLLLALEQDLPANGSSLSGFKLPLSNGVDQIWRYASFVRDRFAQWEVVPLHILAAALLRDPRTLRLFGEFDITAEKVLKTIRTEVF